MAWPKRHWCFFGEIVNVVTFGRLVIHVRDVTGRELRVALYDDNRGRKFMSTSIRGHTVAILYALSHAFLDGGSGIKVEDEDNMTVSPHRQYDKIESHGKTTQILPFSLQELLLANEKIFSPPDRKRCARPSCKNRGNHLCIACKTVFYCSAVSISSLFSVSTCLNDSGDRLVKRLPGQSTRKYASQLGL